ncbi:MAG: glucose/arabinose dehydrogenase [Planctomycetota bacterium]|jgi:glucose/arabinose dehydrogenase
MLIGIAVLACMPAVCQEPEALPSIPQESDYLLVEGYPLTEEQILEVGGITFLPDGRPMVCTRRGEVYIVKNAFAENIEDASLELFTDGLQEPLGLLAEEDGWIYLTQRGEVSRMRDDDGDGRMDRIETICEDWELSGNYHEYCFGPRRAPDGSLWITLNKPFGPEPFGRVEWRGYAMRLDGRKAVPEAAGLRSPAGVEFSPWGELFYTDNQGEWCGASKLSLITPGSFHGHPHGVPSAKSPRWKHPLPPDSPNGILFPLFAEQQPTFQMPAVWFPYDKVGRSPAGIAWDTKGAFGPFKGQCFVVDQYEALIMRVSLEQVDGHWQGAVYRFREGLACGAIRLAFADDGSLLVGETNRGWGGKGSKSFGLERVRWRGETPFEVLSTHAKHDGFELRFTKPVDKRTAKDTDNYKLESYTYLLHSDYGSPEVERQQLEVRSVKVSEDGLSVRLKIDGLRKGYVHEFHLDGLLESGGAPLLHAAIYYTLSHLAPPE